MGARLLLRLFCEICLSILLGAYAGYMLSNMQGACSPLDICGSVLSYTLMVSFFCVLGSALCIFKIIVTDLFRGMDFLVYKTLIRVHGFIGVFGWAVLILSLAVVFK